MSAIYCRATMTLVEQNKMRPGYDCRCSGCMAYVALHGSRGLQIARSPDSA